MHDKDVQGRSKVAWNLVNNSLAISHQRKKAMRYSYLPQPILFHPLKHHLAYIREFIQMNIDADDSYLKAQFKTIGSSQLDLYLGRLSAQQIAHETILYLQEHQTIGPDAYRIYLLESKASYGLITLSDGSNWVLRWGIVAERHVHLHPARYSPHTLRIKANTLKTALAVHIAARRYNQPVGLQLVNQVRTQWLGLAPIPAFLPGGALASLVCLLDAG
jgi:hypothetical protein